MRIEKINISCTANELIIITHSGHVAVKMHVLEVQVVREDLEVPNGW